MESDLIEQFIEKKSIQALKTFLTAEDEKSFTSAATKIADAFGESSPFKKIADPATEAETKLITSFQNNIVLLVQKTWVEKSDEDLKAQVVYRLEQFCKQMNKKQYKASYTHFLNIVNDVVYLMFGSQAKCEDFDEYALRIDPEFGIFWWYVAALPQTADWDDSKSRVAILLAMYFLANY